jgi:hypothetical protein
MADANAESIQQKIQMARRDAEGLKDRIKRKKDELADTTCEYSRHLLAAFVLLILLPCCQWKLTNPHHSA